MVAPTLKFKDCDIHCDDSSATITIKIHNKTLSFGEKDKPRFDAGTGEVVIEYTGRQADNNTVYSWAKAVYDENGYSVAHYHKELTEDYYIISGTATVIINNESKSYNPGDHIKIMPNQIHQVINTSKEEKLALIVRCVPAWKADDFHLAKQFEAGPTCRPTQL